MLSIYTALASTARFLFAVVAGLLVSGGQLSPEQAADPTVVVAALLTLGWSFYEKYRTNKETEKRVKEAVDAVYETGSRDAALERLRATGGLRD